MKREYVLEVVYEGFHPEEYYMTLTEEDVQEFEDQLYEYILNGFGAIMIPETGEQHIINVQKILRASVRIQSEI